MAIERGKFRLWVDNDRREVQIKAVGPQNGLIFSFEDLEDLIELIQQTYATLDFKGTGNE